MKFLIIWVSIYLNLFQIIDSKLYRVMIEDKILPHFDSKISPYTDYFSIDNFQFEQIDDDNVQIGGYLEAKKSMNRQLPLVLNVRTQNYEKSTWNDAVFTMTLPNGCPEFSNPQQMWYNMTKLWTLQLCPSQEGDKWEIETNVINIVYDVAPSIPIVPWRGYIRVSQGLPGFETLNFGFGLEVNLIAIN